MGSFNFEQFQVKKEIPPKVKLKFLTRVPLKSYILKKN